jgi:hypothetical protein
MAKYQVEVTETVYYYILVDAENEEEAKKYRHQNRSSRYGVQWRFQ